MLNVDLVGHRKPEFRAIRVIRVQKPRTPEGYIPSVHLIAKLRNHPYMAGTRGMLNVEC